MIPKHAFEPSIRIFLWKGSYMYKITAHMCYAWNCMHLGCRLPKCIHYCSLMAQHIENIQFRRWINWLPSFVIVFGCHHQFCQSSWNRVAWKSPLTLLCGLSKNGLSFCLGNFPSIPIWPSALSKIIFTELMSHWLLYENRTNTSLLPYNSFSPHL